MSPDNPQVCVGRRSLDEYSPSLFRPEPRRELIEDSWQADLEEAANHRHADDCDCPTCSEPPEGPMHSALWLADQWGPPMSAAEFNRRYKEAGGCPCWIEISLHDGHCCFDSPEPCAEHEEKMLAVMNPVWEPNVEGVHVGDFFVSHWGYDQTNVDFYKVVGLTAKRVKVQKWTSLRLADYRLMPGHDQAIFERWPVDDSPPEAVPAAVRVKEVKTYSDRPFIVINSYANAYLWDGRPQSDTTTSGGAGH